MFLLNIVFIGPVQDNLFILMTAPLYAASLVEATHLTWLDGVTAILFLGLLLIEVVADDQQLMFQTKKFALLEFVHNDRNKLTGDYKRGFLCSSGLWKYSRHPNFFAEQAMWWAVYLFSIITRVQAGDATWSDPGLYLHWTGLGAFFLTLLFQGSTWLTEVLQYVACHGKRWRANDACSISPRKNTPITSCINDQLTASYRGSRNQCKTLRRKGIKRCLNKVTNDVRMRHSDRGL